MSYSERRGSVEIDETDILTHLDFTPNVETAPVEASAGLRRSPIVEAALGMVVDQALAPVHPAGDPNLPEMAAFNSAS